MRDGARAVEGFIKEHFMTTSTHVRLALDLIAVLDHCMNRWRVLWPRLSIDTIEMQGQDPRSLIVIDDAAAGNAESASR